MLEMDKSKDICDGPLAVVVMSKSPVVGKVKTRLGSKYTAMQCAEIHCAMLQCVLDRLGALAGKRGKLRLYLALDDISGDYQQGLEIECSEDWQLIDQGSGDLGDRLKYVWDEVGVDRVVFLGGDSPDFPIDGLLRAIEGVCGGEDVVLGGSDDGGYWIVGGSRFYPQLFSGIDWGSERVYYQTVEAASGLGVYDVGQWYDVDTPEDLDRLRMRLGDVCEDELVRLGIRLDRIIKG